MLARGGELGEADGQEGFSGSEWRKIAASEVFGAFEKLADGGFALTEGEGDGEAAGGELFHPLQTFNGAKA